MAQKFKQKRAPDGETRSDDEIWNNIRYLDRDRELNRSDIVAVVVLMLLLILIGVIMFLFNH